MAFKMKSGSPMKRNFGVGKSPVKQTSPMKDTGSAWIREKQGKEAWSDTPDEEMKNYAIQHDKRHDESYESAHGYPEPKETEEVLPMKSPMKDRKGHPRKVDEAAHIKKRADHTHDWESIEPTPSKPLPMKSPLRDTESPINRNFNINASPMRQVDKNWPEGKITLEQQLKSFKADLADAKASGDTESIRKIKQDIASTKKEIAQKAPPK